MVFNRFRKYAKKAYKSKAGKFVRKVTGDRYGRTSKQIATKGINQLAKDVYFMKKLMNVEKKRASQYVRDTLVGQVDGNNAGYYAGDMTPLVSENVAYNGRTGASLKLVSQHFFVQIINQSGLETGVKLRFMLIKTVGEPETIDSTLVSKFYSDNTIVGLVDYNSPRNPDNFRNFIVVRSWTMHLQPVIDNQSQVKTRQIGVKYKSHHVRFDKDSTTCRGGQLWLLIVADTGNKSGSTVCTNPYVNNVGINTGVKVNLSCTHYYVDN